MRRREFLAALGGVATGWPLDARAQQPTGPVVGFLYPGSPETMSPRVAALRRGLSEMGFVEGRNVRIEYRWAYNELDRLQLLAGDLVRLQVAAIAVGTTVAAQAAKAATSTIPIIFSAAGDPVTFGLVTSLSRPGGNVTGTSNMSTELGVKRLGLLRELLPGVMRFGVLVDPQTPTAQSIIAELRAAALSLGLQMEVLFARTGDDIDAAFAAAIQRRCEALLQSPNPLFTIHKTKLLALEARHALPVIYIDRESAEAGGLMSYGAAMAEEFYQVGLYTGRVLKGAKPADLPVLQPTKFELVINLKSAKAMGFSVPPKLLALADEVIE
jgi:putative tryptophan/tyrosine transport system substrate-binding protein